MFHIVNRIEKMKPNQNNIWNFSESKDCCLYLQYKYNEETLVISNNLSIHTRTSAEGSANLNIPIIAWQTERQMWRQAVNNRTRERNYANLCLRLAEGQISDEEFEQEIIENEDRYVISFPEVMSVEEVKMAAQMTEGILDVDSEDDFRELFSINSTSFSKALKK